jgi:hypothetical protein
VRTVSYRELQAVGMDALDLQFYVRTVGALRDAPLQPDTEVPVSEWAEVVHDVHDLLRVAAACEDGLALLQRIVTRVGWDLGASRGGALAQWCHENAVRRAECMPADMNRLDMLEHARELAGWVGMGKYFSRARSQLAREHAYAHIRRTVVAALLDSAGDVSRILTS